MTRTAGERLRALFHMLGLTRYALAGHDIGAWIAYPYAARHADEVERVVLLDANIPGVTLKPAIELGPDNWKSWHFLFNSVPDLPEALLRARAHPDRVVLQPQDGQQARRVQRRRHRRVRTRLPDAGRPARHAGLLPRGAPGRLAEPRTARRAVDGAGAGAGRRPGQRAQSVRGVETAGARPAGRGVERLRPLHTGRAAARAGAQDAGVPAG